MRFTDVIGQEKAKERLLRNVKDGRISHAQLFVGPEGSGNLSLAIAYAQFISCEDKQLQDSCGNCLSCVKYKKLIHPDLHFSFPVATTKQVTKNPTSKKFMEQWREAILSNPYLNLNDWGVAMGIENKQPIINAEECNEIVQKLSLKPFESEYKIMIIWLPEKLFHSAAPKLLKILEEPPDKTLFLLVSNDAQQLLPTIISRLQVVKLSKLSNDVILAYLDGDHKPQTLDSIVQRADGNMNMARKLMKEGPGHFEFQDSYLFWMRVCYSIQKNDNMAKLIDWADELSRNGREYQKQFLHYALQITRECMIMNYADPGLLKLGKTEIIAFEKFAPFINGANVILITHELNDALHAIERNANPRILFLDLSLKLAKLIKMKTPIATEST